MADPPSSSLFHQRFFTGDKPLLTLDDEFLRNHTKVLLRSDVTERIWEVKLDGKRLAGGWEEFAAVHNYRDGDVLVFRHDGDELFHVAVSSRSSDIHHSSPSYVDTDDTEIDDDCAESDEYDDDEDEDIEDDGSEGDAGNILVSKNKKPEADSSSGYSCFLRVRVTPYSLINDRLDLSRDFTVVSFDEHNKPCEIDLVNEKGRKWTLVLRKNSLTGVFYIRRGWANFCSANGLRQGDFCNFKVSEYGERPVLLLCPQESGNGHEEDGEKEKEKNCPEADAVKICSVGGCSKEKRTVDEVSKGKEKNTPKTFLTVNLTLNRFQTGQLYISSVFVCESGIKKSGEITLLDKDGRKWSSYLHMTGKGGSEWFYLRKGWREMCEANGVKVNDSFVLELIWEDATPMFKFCSKIENKGKGNRLTRKKRACETALHAKTVEKTPKVETEGQRVRKRGRTWVSNRHNTNSRKFQRTQPASCSVSDQVANVKRSIQDTLNTVRQFRVELETREKNLEASLLEVGNLGEKILGISQTLNNYLA